APPVGARLAGQPAAPRGAKRELLREIVPRGGGCSRAVTPPGAGGRGAALFQTAANVGPRCIFPGPCWHSARRSAILPFEVYSFSFAAKRPSPSQTRSSDERARDREQ